MSDILMQAETRLNEMIADIGETTGKQHPTLNDGVQELKKGYGQGEWYDFVVELTSDVINGAELIEVLTPYLTNLRPHKDMAFCTLLNADKKASTDSTTTPLLWGVFRKDTVNKIGGSVSRYRGATEASIINIVEAATGYGCVGLAGDKYYVKVVNILA